MISGKDVIKCFHKKVTMQLPGLENGGNMYAADREDALSANGLQDAHML